jgi:hypothetical protein
MKAQIYGSVGIVALLVGIVGCKKDPTADGVGTPSEVVLDLSTVTLGPGDSATVTAQIVDNRLTPVEGDISFSTCDAAVATVALDPTFDPRPPTAKRAVIHAVSAPATCIIAASGATKPDTVSVGVLPTAFPGTPSTTSPQVGQPLTIQATGTLKFGATTDISFGGDHGFVLDQTADAITVAVPQPETPAAGPVDVENIVVTYVPGLRVTLPTSTSFSAVTSPYGVHDAPDPAGANLTIPADGGPDLVFYDGFKTTDVDFFYTFTLAKTDTLTFVLEWPTDADLDMANCTAGCGAFVGGFAAATGANPEHYSVIFTPGTYNLLVEQFDPGEGAHSFKVTIQNP